MSDKAPVELFHYTSSYGLLEIIRQREMWATDTRFLNDERELKHGLELIVEILTKRREGESDKDTLLWFDNLIQTAANRIENMSADLESAIYVSCFSEDGDSLSQWRGYAGNSGYSIGFRSKQFKNFKLERIGSTAGVDYDALSAFGVNLQKVSYDSNHGERAVKLIAELRAKLRSSISKLAPGRERLLKNMDTVVYRFAPLMVTSAASRLKHSGFSDEREWRYSITSSSVADKPKYRASDSFGLVPYLTLGFDPATFITRIKVGPGANMDARVLGIRSYLHSVGLNEIEVEKSNVPYRS